MKLKRISAVALSLILGTVHLGNVLAAETEENTAEEAVVLEEESTASGSAAEALIEETEPVVSADLAYSGITLDSLNTRVNRIGTYTPGETVERTYLKITPISEVSYGDTITLNFSNAVVLDEQETFEDLQGNGSTSNSYESLVNMYLNGATARMILINLWGSNGGNLDDIFIPWRLTKLSDTSVQVELFPLPKGLCNISYSSISEPYYYIPLSVKASSVGKACVSITAGKKAGSDICFAYVVENEGDDVSSYITEDPDGDYTRIKYEDGSPNLYIIPWDEVTAGDSIILYYENAVVPDDLPAFEDYQCTRSYDDLYAQLLAGTKAASVLMDIWGINGGNLDDIFIPWKMTKLSDSSIKVDLFPIPWNMTDVYYSSSAKPYYYLPIEVEAEEGAEVNLLIDHNGSPISGGEFYDILGDASADLAALNSLNTRVNRIGTYTPGETTEREYLKITPLSEVSYGDTITLNFSNAVVLDEQETFEDLQGNGSTSNSYETLVNMYLNGTTAKMILQNLWGSYGGNLDDIFIPWRLTKLSDTSVQVELFPIPEGLCNISYSSMAVPYYYIPIYVQISGVGKAYVSVSIGETTGSDLCFAYVVENEGDDVSSYITEDRDVNYTRIKYEDGSPNLYIRPWGEVEAGDSIILYYENAAVPDDLPAFEDYQCTSSYDDLYAQFTAGTKAANVLRNIWGTSGGNLDDIFIPWKMTKLSDSSIKVDLFPIPSRMADVNYSSSSKPYYYLPLEIEAEEGAEVNLIIDHNGSPVSGGKLYNILENELLYNSSTGAVTGYTGYAGSSADVVIPGEIDGTTITSISAEAFKDCEWLNSVTIADSITNIYSEAFYGCENLTSVTILSDDIEINFSAFQNCTSLAFVYCYEGSTADDASLYPDGVTIVYLSESETVTGDITGDGNVDALDVMITAQLATGAVTDEEKYLNADVTGDGVVNALDVMKLAQYATGAISNL